MYTYVRIVYTHLLCPLQSALSEREQAAEPGGSGPLLQSPGCVREGGEAPLSCKGLTCGQWD